MATAKTYEMLFALNARMNGGFSGTFSKAQAEFSRLGKEIQDLHRLQGDISSFQKQQAAVQNTTAKLDNLRQQEALLIEQIKAARNAEEHDAATIAGLEREKVKLEQRIKDTETALERQNQKLQTTGAKLKEAGVDTANLAQKDQELTARIKELQEEQDRAAQGAASFGEQTVQAFEAAGQAVATAGVAMALKEITDAFLECVGVAGDFEEAMSTVEALSQANAQEMAALTAEAKELGATTKFTAKESADAMGYMAMAGWNAQQMMSGMDGVIQLAAASGEDLAMVSDIVTDNLTAFGLAASDTAHFADVLAAAATNSNTNVSIMGETFKQSASIAGALGYNIEDVAVAVGLMANAGVKGSIAGTALKNTFNGLLEGVTLTGAAFGEYDFTAIKADGTMKNFMETIEELRDVFMEMTEAERVNNAMALAGQRGYNGLLAILNATEEDFSSLALSIDNCTGAAQRMAAVKLDNLNGQLTLMNSAWDALRTTIGEEFNPELRRAAEIGTDVLTWVNEFVQEHPALVKGVMTFTGAMGAATVAITGASAAMKVFQALNVAALFTGPAGAILGGAAAVAGLTAAVVGLVTAANDGGPAVKELTEATRDMKDAMDDAGAAYNQTANQTLAVAQAAETYIAKLEELGEGTDASDEHSRAYLNTLSLLCNALPELTEYVNLETGAIEGGTEALRSQTEAWKKKSEAQAYQEYMNGVMGQYNEVMTESAANSLKLTEAEIKLEKIEKAREAGLARMNELESKGAALTNEEQAEYYQLQDALLGYNSEMLDAVDAVRTYTEAVEKDNEALAEAEAVLNDTQEAYERLTGVTGAQTEAEAEAARQTQELQGVIETTAERIAGLAEAYNDAYNAALESIQGQYALWDEADKVVATSAGSINSALESQITYWDNYNQNLESLRERTADIEGLGDVIASFADGSTDSVNAIAGMASASDKDLAAMVENWQELQQAQSDASQSIADLKTDFSNQMDELQQELAADIEAMDLSDEAIEAGRATIQGYINAVNDMLPQVQSGYQTIALAAFNSMGPVSYSNRVLDKNRPRRGYASGTEDAQPGWAMVGENGPELMFFNGGEKVLNAAQTSALQAKAEPAVSAKLAAGGGSRVAAGPVQVTFQIGGSATQETVQDLREFADDIVDRVVDVLEDRDADAMRRALV